MKVLVEVECYIEVDNPMRLNAISFGYDDHMGNNDMIIGVEKVIKFKFTEVFWENEDEK